MCAVISPRVRVGLLWGARLFFAAALLRRHLERNSSHATPNTHTQFTAGPWPRGPSVVGPAHKLLERRRPVAVANPMPLESAAPARPADAERKMVSAVQAVHAVVSAAKLPSATVVSPRNCALSQRAATKVANSGAAQSQRINAVRKLSSGPTTLAAAGTLSLAAALVPTETGRWEAARLAAAVARELRRAEMGCSLPLR